MAEHAKGLFLVQSTVTRVGMAQTIVPHDQEARLLSVKWHLEKAGSCPVSVAVSLSPTHSRASGMTCARTQGLSQGRRNSLQWARKTRPQVGSVSKLGIEDKPILGLQGRGTADVQTDIWTNQQKREVVGRLWRPEGAPI